MITLVSVSLWQSAGGADPRCGAALTFIVASGNRETKLSYVVGKTKQIPDGDGEEHLGLAFVRHGAPSAPLALALG